MKKNCSFQCGSRGAPAQRAVGAGSLPPPPGVSHRSPSGPSFYSQLASQPHLGHSQATSAGGSYVVFAPPDRLSKHQPIHQSGHTLRTIPLLQASPPSPVATGGSQAQTQQPQYPPTSYTPPPGTLYAPPSLQASKFPRQMIVSSTSASLHDPSLLFNPPPANTSLAVQRSHIQQQLLHIAQLQGILALQQQQFIASQKRAQQEGSPTEEHEKHIKALREQQVQLASHQGRLTAVLNNPALLAAQATQQQQQQYQMKQGAGMSMQVPSGLTSAVGSNVPQAYYTQQGAQPSGGSYQPPHFGQQQGGQYTNAGGSATSMVAAPQPPPLLAQSSAMHMRQQSSPNPFGGAHVKLSSSESGIPGMPSFVTTSPQLMTPWGQQQAAAAANGAGGLMQQAMANQRMSSSFQQLPSWQQGGQQQQQYQQPSWQSQSRPASFFPQPASLSAAPANFGSSRSPQQYPSWKPENQQHQQQYQQQQQQYGGQRGQQQLSPQQISQYASNRHQQSQQQLGHQSQAGQQSHYPAPAQLGVTYTKDANGNYIRVNTPGFQSTSHQLFQQGSTGASGGQHAQHSGPYTGSGSQYTTSAGQYVPATSSAQAYQGTERHMTASAGEVQSPTLTSAPTTTEVRLTMSSSPKSMTSGNQLSAPQHGTYTQGSQQQGSGYQQTSQQQGGAHQSSAQQQGEAQGSQQQGLQQQGSSSLQQSSQSQYNQQPTAADMSATMGRQLATNTTSVSGGGEKGGFTTSVQGGASTGGQQDSSATTSAPFVPPTQFVPPVPTSSVSKQEGGAVPELSPRSFSMLMQEYGQTKIEVRNCMNLIQALIHDLAILKENTASLQEQIYDHDRELYPERNDDDTTGNEMWSPHDNAGYSARKHDGNPANSPRVISSDDNVSSLMSSKPATAQNTPETSPSPPPKHEDPVDIFLTEFVESHPEINLKISKVDPPMYLLNGQEAFITEKDGVVVIRDGVAWKPFTDFIAEATAPLESDEAPEPAPVKKAATKKSVTPTKTSTTKAKASPTKKASTTTTKTSTTATKASPTKAKLPAKKAVAPKASPTKAKASPTKSSTVKAK